MRRRYLMRYSSLRKITRTDNKRRQSVAMGMDSFSLDDAGFIGKRERHCLAASLFQTNPVIKGRKKEEFHEQGSWK